MKKLILSVLLLTMVSGCSSTRIPQDNSEYNYENLEANILEEWELKEIPIQYIDADVSFGIERRNKVPEDIKGLVINDLSIGSGGTLSTLKSLLRAYDINLFIPSEAINDMPFEISDFNGDLGDLLSVIEEGYDLSFSYTGGKNIILRDFSIFTAPIPQDEESAEDLVASIESLGGEETSYSLAGGFVIYRASHNNQEGIKEYLNSYYRNFAVIKLQVAVITVTLDREVNSGFDWSSLQAIIGNGDLISLAAGDITGAVGAGVDAIIDGSGDSGEGSSEGGEQQADPEGRAIGFNANQVMGRYKRGNRDIQAAFNLLNTYGVSNATQSIFLETISGKELELRSGKEIPYTSNINQNVVGGNNGNSTSLSGFQAQKEREGLTVTFQPYFNYKKNTVTLGLDLNLRTIVGFQEINSGNSNGTVEQPITQEQEFNSVVEIRPGEAHLVGGITFTLDSDNRNNLNFLGDLPTASQRSKTNQNALFILLRPTVSIYGEQFDEGD